ncbi:MAG: sigma 54 modulation/S30EA ribosomal C-terminal domain-containing protein [Myxococcota bacterium]
MDLLDSEFLVFTNAMSQEVNVIYRLPDGKYGLIEAQPANLADNPVEVTAEVA